MTENERFEEATRNLNIWDKYEYARAHVEEFPTVYARYIKLLYIAKQQLRKRR